MATMLINYTLASTTIKNPDGSYPATTTACKFIAGPGGGPYGNFPTVVEFGAGSKVTTTINARDVNAKQFCITIIFKPKAGIAGRMILAECSALPFTLWVEAASVLPAAVGVDVKSANLGVASVDSRFRTSDLNMAGWNKLELVYDQDALILVLNNKVLGVTGLTNGQLAAATGTQLCIGQKIAATGVQFQGQIAIFSLSKGIPSNTAVLIRGVRTFPEWAISRKYMDLRNVFPFGNALGGIEFSPEIPAYMKRWATGAVIAPVGAGTAFEIHGLIYAAYKANSNLKGLLGIPLSDEIDAHVPGTRKNMFNKGGIYFSPGSGAVPVFGVVYAEYESLGGPSHVIGFPTKAAVPLSNGAMQEFQNGHMYLDSRGQAAFEVHGLILERFKSIGGINKMGFPNSHELPILNASGVEIGRQSQFSRGTIFFCPGIGTFEVTRAIHTKYMREGGVNSTLGLPTSGESLMPGSSFLKGQTFQRGSIVDANGDFRVVTSFKIHVGMVATEKSENDGSSNDLIIWVKVLENGAEVFAKRFPDSGNYNNSNSRDVNCTTQLFIPNNLNKEYTLSVRVEDYDDFLNLENDKLGTFTTKLNAANAWGFSDPAITVFESGKTSKIKNITWAVQPELPANYKLDFWKVGNPRMPTGCTKQMASEAIRDFDSEPEWWDPTDWLDYLFYETVLKNAGKGGNCYGLSVYGLKAWEGNAVHSMPLMRHEESVGLRRQFAVHHAMQHGDRQMGWMLDQYTGYHSQNPKAMFTNSRQAFLDGNHPVLCFRNNANLFGSKGHCILPFEWDDSGPIWKIHVFDPNKNGNPTSVSVDPVKNTWKYEMSETWEGGFRTGGRMYHVPASITQPRPRTPYWAVLGRIPDLLLYATSELLTMAGILDENGATLDFSNVVTGSTMDILKMFFAFNGMGDETGLTGTMMMRPNAGKLSPAALQALAATTQPDWSKINLGDGFTHKMVGKATGHINLHMAQQLGAFNLSGQINVNETLSFGARNFNSPDRLMTIKSGTARTYGIKSGTRFGIKGDGMTVSFAFPTKANLDAKLMIDPALSRIELMTSGTAMPTTIEIKGRIGNVLYTKVFDTQIEGATRFDLQNVLYNGIITGGKIDALRGSIIVEKSISAR